MTRFPGVAFRGDDVGRRAWVIGSGLDVWEIAHMADDFGAPEALAKDSHLSPAQIRIALAYRDAHPDEIEQFIEENRRALDDLRVLHPFIEVAGA